MDTDPTPADHVVDAARPGPLARRLAVIVVVLLVVASAMAAFAISRQSTRVSKFSSTGLCACSIQ